MRLKKVSLVWLRMKFYELERDPSPRYTGNLNAAHKWGLQAFRPRTRRNCRIPGPFRVRSSFGCANWYAP